MGETVGVLAKSACDAASRNCTSYIQESLQNTIPVGNFQSRSNVNPANCWVAC